MKKEMSHINNLSFKTLKCPSSFLSCEKSWPLKKKRKENVNKWKIRLSYMYPIFPIYLGKKISFKKDFPNRKKREKILWQKHTKISFLNKTTKKQQKRK